ncbi:Transcription termination and cleavage factor C-terminal domain [Arabidopsis suecica]|uniref:Transcription termination and cleavage factor C-terminal domain n=1 Tax=Arabidopsis suecica TaxID=45249 RepID=A0A8T2HHJ0_ARASU|nr:Transcription termination and cleavage factor C-terminal domain [Arabidopsis suecica]
MAGKQIGGDGGLPANLAGMTKSQLYDIMSQMKTLIDQNHQQAREILIRNPLLTKALFQAQIMLGMVQPPQVTPKVEPQAVQQPQQSHQSIPPKPNVQAHMSSFQGGGSVHEPANTMQPQAPIRKHPTPQPMPMPPPPPSVSANSAQSQPRFSHPQRQGHLNPAVTSMSHPQSSQVQNAPPPASHHPTSQQPPFHHLDIPASSTQLQQQPMHSGGGPHVAQQQSRPYHHQYGQAQTGPNTGFQHHGAPTQHLSQPMYHSGNRPPASGGPQFPQGQPNLPSQPTYQGGGQYRGDYNNNQLAGLMAQDRGPSWMAGQSESSNITHLPGLGPVPPPSQVGPGGGPPPRPAPISAEMEKALLQQVMSLTPEQINLLPPEQRNQVLQLQQILRQ